MTTSGTLKIRPAEASDRDTVQQLWDTVGLSRAAPDEWDALAAGGTSAVLLGEQDGETVGTAIASFDGWRAYLYHVAVDARYRRRGIGRELMERAEQNLLNAGARYVYVMVNEENTDALALAGSLGYLPEGDIVLAKRLA